MLSTFLQQFERFVSSFRHGNGTGRRAACSSWRKGGTLMPARTRLRGPRLSSRRQPRPTPPNPLPTLSQALLSSFRAHVDQSQPPDERGLAPPKTHVPGAAKPPRYRGWLLYPARRDQHFQKMQLIPETVLDPSRPMRLRCKQVPFGEGRFQEPSLLAGSIQRHRAFQDDAALNREKSNTLPCLRNHPSGFPLSVVLSYSRRHDRRPLPH